MKLKLKLRLIDRIILNSIIPSEGNMKQLIIFDDIRKKVGLKQDEVKEFELDFVDNAIKWNDKGATTIFDISFTDLEKDEIVKIIKKLDEKNKVPSDMIPLCKMFKLM